MKSGNDHPTIIVVFGATGDLFKKKLSQALFDLYQTGHLPTPFRIVGFSRKPLSHEEFRSQIKEYITAKKQEYDEAMLSSFVSLAYYERGDINDIGTYTNLGKILERMDKEAGVCMNKLFYLAVPPPLYQPIFENLVKSGLTIPCAPSDREEKGWSRVLVEKPFGSDQEEASKLDILLGSLFEEDQIFRIDHYLAKETIQNILTFRFSNSLFEPLWNRDNIEKVEIRLLEAGTAKDRGGFYDKIGALRDVGQNHLLAMLALVGMENPGKLEADAIRNARVALLKQVRPYEKNPATYAMRAQYEGYRNEQGISPDSKTETYFKIKMEIKNSRWKGVPFYLESGKALPDSLSEIVIYFKEPAVCICPPPLVKHSHENILTFRIQPNEGISVLFWAKRPGFDFELETRSLSFSYKNGDSNTFKLPDAYERVLYDCIRGDQTLFASTDEMKVEWKIITPISKALEEIPLLVYKPGEYPKSKVL